MDIPSHSEDPQINLFSKDLLADVTKLHDDVIKSHNDLKQSSQITKDTDSNQPLLTTSKNELQPIEKSLVSVENGVNPCLGHDNIRSNSVPLTSSPTEVTSSTTTSPSPNFPPTSLRFTRKLTNTELPGARNISRKSNIPENSVFGKSNIPENVDFGKSNIPENYVFGKSNILDIPVGDIQHNPDYQYWELLINSQYSRTRGKILKYVILHVL